jgi:hypothetical protein
VAKIEVVEHAAQSDLYLMLRLAPKARLAVCVDGVLAGLQILAGPERCTSDDYGAPIALLGSQSLDGRMWSGDDAVTEEVGAML